MKIRNGFVSNSSSSSFILGFKGDFHYTVPKRLEKILRDAKMYSSDNLSRFLRKVQENDIIESLSEQKRRIVEDCRSEAIRWFSNNNAWVLENRKKWEQEDPVSYKKHVELMELEKSNPILAAEKLLDTDEFNDVCWEINDIQSKIIPSILKKGYKVCYFSLEYSGDVADSNKFPDWKEMHQFTDKLVKSQVIKDIEYDNFKIVRVY